MMMMIIIIITIIIILMRGSWRRSREESEHRRTKRKPATQHIFIMAVLVHLAKNTANNVWEMLARNTESGRRPTAKAESSHIKHPAYLKIVADMS